MKNCSLLLISFLYPIFLLGNISVNDSLLIKLGEANDSTKIHILEELALLPNVSIDQQITYLNQAIHIANNTNNPIAKANTLFLLGTAYESKGSFDQALVACEEALIILNENNKLFESTKVLALIGEVYAFLENYDIAINHFKQALEICNQIGDKIQISKALINVGNVMAMKGNLDEAMEYYQKALDLKEELRDLNGLSQLYNNIANIHFAKGEMNKVLPYRLKALNMDRESGDQWQIALKTYNLAEYYLTIEEPNKAYPYIIESKTIAEKLENYGLINDNIQFLSQYYELLNDNKKALEYQKLYATSIKETFSKELSEQVGEMQVKYETEKKDKEAQVFKLRLEENQNQKLVLLFLVIIGFLITGFTTYLYLKKKKNNQSLEKKVSKRTNELRKKNEELERNSIELRNAKIKAEESSRLKSAFLTNMSHEIRTPMNGILGFTSLLIDKNLEAADKEKYAGIIQKGGDRLISTIDDIIEASRIETEQVEINKTEISVNVLVEDVYCKFNSLDNNKKIKFSLTKGLPKNELTIVSDRSKIETILSQLLKNAFKFTKEGFIDFGCNVRDNFLEFYIKDSGIGVPPDRQAAIFDLFLKSDIEDKDAYQGNGLGLFIAKSYAELLGGKMWVKSNIITGSTFYFTIPFQNNHVEKTNINMDSNKTGPKGRTRKLKVLIVEDDYNSDIYLTAIIENLTKDILHASNGLDAIKACQENNDIDLILMDLKMPEMNGVDAVRKIREFNTNVYIIAQTAFALIGDREIAIEAGCNDYISKPIRKVDLIAKISKLI